ncbi:class I SAM-dependent methyltransferase [Effusibacillus dendaii]|uniref:SAM-dependent methyltransferase n=1 Tax=Effusibacillus dendaii TaxID=2743772 RepID=A0A7I8DC65_9BACL|nr:methyltransferase [Effusibacillus dendaii]BCJ87773.1 SAM-dependent methyltransferase [Effusibacillus dendaii]
MKLSALDYSFDKLLFLSKFVRSPRTVGSLVPSSRFLANAVLAPINWDEIYSIAELGAGTGAFTRCIAERRRSSCISLIFERDDDMRARLQFQYPAENYFKEAVNLSHALDEFHLKSVDCIVSGLPFANFTQQKRAEILQQVKSNLSSGGQFITFQYSLQMKQQLSETFRSVKIGFVPFNFPPAFVYYCRK